MSSGEDPGLILMGSNVSSGVQVIFRNALEAFINEGILAGDFVRDSQPSSSSRSLSQISYTLTSGARVVKAWAIVRAAPPYLTPIAQVAEVRADVQGRVVLDFGRMRTVRGVRPGRDNTIQWALPWLGSQFGPASGSGNVTSDPAPNPDNDQYDFSELQTERLLLVPPSSESPLDDEYIKTHGYVVLSSAPADLEVLVGGKRAWFQPGEAKRGATGLFGTGVSVTENDYFLTAVDITDALTAALARDATAPIELRAASPGVLEIEHKVSLQRVHAVQFPEGPERVATFAEEGSSTLLLPVPTEASQWSILGLSFSVAAKLPPNRVLPPVGPTISPHVELVLDAEHAVAINIPASQSTPFGALTAVRARVYVEAGGTELGGSLLADVNGEPGAPIPGGELAPLTVAEAPRSSNTPIWVTLATARPLAVPRGQPMWVSLQASRGTVVMPLVTTGNAVRRGMPGGPWRAFANVTTLSLAASVRLVGTGPEGAPIDALRVELSGKTPVLSMTPPSDGATGQIIFEQPVAASGVISGGAITLSLTASTPGSYRFKDVQVLYRLPIDPL